MSSLSACNSSAQGVFELGVPVRRAGIVRGEVREQLAAQYNLGNREPNIQVYEVDVRGDRSMTLRHDQFNRLPLGDATNEVLKHIHRLWGFDVRLHSYREDKIVQSFHCPPKS